MALSDSHTPFTAEANAAAFLLVDVNGCILAHDDAAIFIFGHDAAPLIGQALRALSPPCDDALGIIRMVLATGQVAPPQPLMMKTADGASGLWRCSARALSDGSLVVTLMPSIRQASAPQTAAGPRAALAVLGARAGLMTWEYLPEAGIFRMDEELTRLIGTPPQFAGEGWLGAVLKEDALAVGDKLHACVAGDTKGFDGEFRLRTASSGYRWCRTWAQAVENDSNGRALRIEGLLQDCSSEKLASLSLQRAREDSLQAARAKATFLATMGHELRTPLNGVLGMLSLLERENLSSDAQEFVQVAMSSGNALFELINTILDYSRLEAGGLKPESTVFELRSLAEDALERVSEAARHKGLELVLRVERSAPGLIETDSARLRQILQSLLGNAVKFTRRGQVVLSIGREDSAGAVTLTVTDSGVGIPEAAQGRIFEPFTQADEGTTREYGGVGLGLSLTRQLARLLGADISVASVQGQGASFTVRFPLTVIVSPAPASKASGAGALAGRRLLLCEPNSAAREALAALLEAHGAQVSAVAGLVEIEPAISAAASGGIDLLLVADADRSRLLELLGRLRKQVAIPVLLLSSARRRIDADEFESCTEGVIAKPVREIPLLSSLQAVLKKAVDRAAPPAANSPLHARSGHKVLVVDDVTTNLTVASRMLSKLGLVVELADSGFAAIDAVAATEYDLIFMDCRMPGMSGLEATEMIRTRYGERAGPRIIAMTANEGQADRDACFAAGMHDFLSKPLLMSELERVVEKWGSPGLRQAGVVQPIAATANTFRAKIDDFLDIMSADDLRQIVRRYWTDGAKRVRALETLLAGGEIAGMAADTHALKGSSSNLGFSVIVELCVRLEAQIQTLDQTNLASTLGELSGAFETQCQLMLDAVEAATSS
jgi:hypothetical protein